MANVSRAGLRPEEPTTATASATRANVSERLIVEEQRDEWGKLSHLLRGQQRLRRGAEDRHLIDGLVLRGAHTLVRFIDIVLFRQRREILGDRRPDRIDRLAVRLVQDRDA